MKKTVSFIRHRWCKEREVSVNTDVFSSAIIPGESYQDVLSFAMFENEKNVMYTFGKHLFPQGNTITLTMSRWMIMFIAEGEMFCGAQRLCKGDFVVIPSTSAIDVFTKNEQVLFYWCTTNDSRHLEILKMCGYVNDKTTFGHTDAIKSIKGLFEDTIYRFPKDCDELVYLMGRMTCVFSYITAELTETEDVSDQIFKRCLRHIDLKRGNVTVDSLAKHYFVSRRYLYSMFMEYKGISPFDYILQVRMETANNYLLNTDYSIQKIAELSGYSNYSHFTRAFTKYYGLSPSKRRHDSWHKGIDEYDAQKKKWLLDE